MNRLLYVFKYIANHPQKTLDEVFSLPKFKGVYQYFEEYKGVKPNRCPTCHKDGALTKHHVIPKKNGGKNMRENYFYICRTCHNIIHEMFTKRQRIERYLLDEPDTSVDELMKKFNAPKYVVKLAMYPEYYRKCQRKYERRVRKKVNDGMNWLENPREAIRLI